MRHKMMTFYYVIREDYRKLPKCYDRYLPHDRRIDNKPEVHLELKFAPNFLCA